MTESSLRRLIKKKNVVYITVKNEDYIRTKQIIRLLEKESDGFVLYTSEKKSPLSRTLDLKKRMRKKEIRFDGADVVIVGFLPQLIWDDVERNIRFGDRETKTIMIADMFLSLYDTVICDRKLAGRNSVVAGWCRKLDRNVVRKAYLIITDTKADKNYFVKEFCGDIDRFEVLYLEARDIANKNDTGKFPDLNIEKDDDRISILYVASGIPAQGTDFVVEAFTTLCDDKAYKCVYIGGLGAMTRKNRVYLKQGRIDYHKWIDRDELIEQIHQADICIVGHFNPEVDKADRTISGKAFIYEKACKTMILGDTVANHEVFSADERHVFVPRGDAKALVDAVKSISGRWHE